MFSASLSFPTAVGNYDTDNVNNEMALVFAVVIIMIVPCVISGYSIVSCSIVLYSIIIMSLLILL